MAKVVDFIGWLKRKNTTVTGVINKMFETGEDLTDKEEEAVRDLVDEYIKKENLTTTEIQQLNKLLNI